MNLYILAYTNDTMPWINVMRIRTFDGREIVLDRDRTETYQTEKENLVDVIWRGVYIWDGSKENYELPKDIFNGAVVETVEIEDDAPEEYYFDPVSCSLYPSFEGTDFEVINLPILKKKGKVHTKMHTIFEKFKKAWLSKGSR